MAQRKRKSAAGRKGFSVSARHLGLAAAGAALLAVGVGIGLHFAERNAPGRLPTAARMSVPPPLIRPAQPPALTSVPDPVARPPVAAAATVPPTPAPAPAALPPAQQPPSQMQAASPPPALDPPAGNGLPAGAPPPLAHGRSSADDSTLPPWRRYAAATPTLDSRPMIAIVIDDMGVDRKRSQRASALPAAVTLAYLPYAQDVGPQVEIARRGGHEILVHLPMEAADRGANPGPNALLLDLDQAELMRRLRWNLDRFSGYVGVNNHMGSRFTASMPGMELVLQELKARGLLFLDSRTAADSIAARLSRKLGMPTAGRDVFLDHVETAENVEKQLGAVEDVARRQGAAIAIGHPHDATLEQLERWLPGLAQRGFQLVPLSVIVSRSFAG